MDEPADPKELEKQLNENAREGFKFIVVPLPDGHMQVRSLKRP